MVPNSRTVQRAPGWRLKAALYIYLGTFREHVVHLAYSGVPVPPKSNMSHIYTNVVHYSWDKCPSGSNTDTITIVLATHVLITDSYYFNLNLPVSNSNIHLWENTWNTITNCHVRDRHIWGRITAKNGRAKMHRCDNLNPTEISGLPQTSDSWVFQLLTHPMTEQGLDNYVSWKTLSTGTTEMYRSVGHWTVPSICGTVAADTQWSNVIHIHTYHSDWPTHILHVVIMELLHGQMLNIVVLGLVLTNSIR